MEHNFCSYCGKSMIVVEVTPPTVKFDVVTGHPYTEKFTYKCCPDYAPNYMTEWESAHDNIFIESNMVKSE